MLRMMVVHQWTIPCKAAVNLDFVTAWLRCHASYWEFRDQTGRYTRIKSETFQVLKEDWDSFWGQQSVYTVKRMGFLIFIK